MHSPAWSLRLTRSQPQLRLPAFNSHVQLWPKVQSITFGHRSSRQSSAYLVPVACSLFGGYLLSLKETPVLAANTTPSALHCGRRLCLQRNASWTRSSCMLCADTASWIPSSRRAHYGLSYASTVSQGPTSGMRPLHQGWSRPSPVHDITPRTS